MKYREIEVFAAKDLGAAGVETIDLDMVDPLTVMYLRFSSKTVTVSDMLASHVSCLSKIELVDGSDVLFSLTGEQAQALAFTMTGVMPLNELNVVVGQYATSIVPIYFGAYLFDPEMAFDPKRFKSPQLKITWDEDAWNTSVVVNSFKVVATAFDEQQITPKGFLMSKEVKSFTPVASSYEYTDMPTDYPYRLLMLQATSTDKTPCEVIDKVKLSEEHDKRIPFDMNGSDLFRLYNQSKGLIHETIRLNETAADAMALYMAPSYLTRGFIQYDADVVAADDDFSQPSFAHNKITIPATVNFVPYTLTVSGYCPYGCLWYQFGEGKDIESFYDVTRLNHLRLVYQAASSVGTSPQTKIITQQFRSY
jgi:hypothetical protein